MMMISKDQLMTTTNNRYNGSQVGIKRHYHPDNKLLFLSEKILEWYYNDELGIIIIHGQQGYGKSTYACISCAEVYGHDINNNRFFYNWSAVKEHIVWTPRQFIELSKQNKDKEPIIVWDDAAYWLNAMDYRDPLCIAVSKYLEVARTRWAAIVFTCSDQRQILSKIRGIPHAWTVPITKAPGTASRFNKDYKWKNDRRYAKLHKAWTSEDLKKYGKKGKGGDIFYARMPSNFYNWYKPWRDSFCKMGIEAVDLAATEDGL